MAIQWMSNPQTRLKGLASLAYGSKQAEAWSWQYPETSD